MGKHFCFPKRLLYRHLSLVFYACLIACIALITFLSCRPSLMEDVSFSRAVFDRHGALMRLTLSKDEKYRLFVPLKDISPLLREAVLIHEDQYFFSHPGINPAALARAFFQTYFGAGRRIGASTITMQLARLKYGINSRHLLGKIWQIVRAMQLELHYSKDQLLEAYFNLVPYGYNIEGAGAASLIYFHKKAPDLTLPESLTLAVIPQSPYRRQPDSGNPRKQSLIKARNRLFTEWLQRHPEHEDQKLFFSLPLVTSNVKDLPFTAPHLTQFLLSRFPHEGGIIATIDTSTQNLMETLLHHYVQDRNDIGINNASALLLDTRTMAVLALIGSTNFSDAKISGQVDGTRAKRSPGSTLKPFIYALALDQGVIHPRSMLVDAPTAFGSYNPSNFDKDFRGIISAEDALRLSRNIPAIMLASKLHSPDLYTFLKKAGIQKLRPKQDYGLTLVLGGAEVTMQELARLYAMLANDGLLKPMAFRLDQQNPQADTSLITPEASFLALDMLKNAVRPTVAASSGGLPIYWKTGTSNGFRDAWAAGVFSHYVLVVWVGNFNGEDNPVLVGIHTAAPLFFNMVNALYHKEKLTDIMAVKANKLHLRRVNICTTTGGLETDNCPAISETWFIPGISPIHKQNVYRKILINQQTGLRACQFQEGVTEYKIFELWPTDIQHAFQAAGIHKLRPPLWEKDCEKNSAQGDGPKITSPQPRTHYQMRLIKEEGDDQVSFSATIDGDVQRVHWFVDNRYVGRSFPDEPFFWKPQPGHHIIRVVDDQGRTDSTDITVSPVP